MRLECVVEFDAPGIVRIFYVVAGCLRCEVVVSVEFDILLYSYAEFSSPEVNISIIIPSIFQLIGHIQRGVAEKVGACAGFDIVNTESPRTNFIGIDFAVVQACGPKSSMAIALVCACTDIVTV